MLKRLYGAKVSTVLLIFLMSGCMVNQERDVKVYRDVLDADLTGPAAQFHPEDPLTLTDAMKLANAQNEQLAMSGEKYLQTLIDKDRAFAAFLPRIRFAPTFLSQGKTSLAPGNPLIAKFVPEHAADSPIEGSMDLHPFRDVPALQAAGSTARMQRALLLDQQAILMLDVSKIYFQVLHSEKQVEVLKHSIEVEEQRLKDIQVKQQAGVARPVDVALTESQLARTRNMLIQAEDDVKNSRAMLAFLIGVPSVNGPLTEDLTVPSEDWQAEPLLKTADAHRQDLKAEHERVKAASVALEGAWGAYFPSVSLDLSRYLTRETFPNDVDWTSLIQINIPIFSAGLIHADVRTAYSRLRQARLAEMYAERSVLKDLRVSTENLRKDDQQIEQLGIQLNAAREGTRQAEAAYDAGLGTNLERLIARDAQLSAELSITTARFNRNVDYLNLLRVTGVLNPALSIMLPIAEK